jgi:hypothetical protein
MTLCFYCETNESTTTRNSEPACDECNNAKFSMISDPSKTKNETDRDRADLLKTLMLMFRHVDKEDRIIKESADPEELMEWLSSQANHESKGAFKYDYEKFINRWKQVFGTTDNIPKSFKNNINAKYKGMRSL